MKVMIIDDSSSMRLIIKRTLKQAGFDGLEFCEAGDGADALNTIDQHNPDLVLCDWNMPVMSGIEFLTRLREQNNPVPLGFVTTESTAPMRARASEAGAQFLIAKPFTAEVFERTLKRFFS
jgi:two-component system chemotaxis response regulator CheY